ncbi:GNAT family N-acetyltransferase [Glaciimonas sp. GG7]
MSKLGINSELIFHRLNGAVENYNLYTMIKTKSCPDSYYGNCLLLSDSPNIKDLISLEIDFQSLIGGLPEISHKFFIWPLNSDEVFNPSEFIKYGYEYSENIVLSVCAHDLINLKKINNVDIHIFSSEKDWKNWEEMLIRDNENYFPENEYHQYLAYQRRIYQSLTDANRGSMWGGYLNGKQVASLGLFFDGNIGRFQSVVTDPLHRNKGICKAMVRYVSLQGLSRVDRLIMVADKSQHALLLYKSLGFKEIERYGSMLWLSNKS